MDRETRKQLSTALAAVLDRIGYAPNEAPTLEEFRDMLGAYLRVYAPLPSREDPEEFRTALATNKPVLDGGAAAVSLNGVFEFLRRRWRCITPAQVRDHLRTLGARPRSIYVRRGYTALIGRRYWSLPDEVVPRVVKEGNKRAAPKGLTGTFLDLEAIFGHTTLLDLLKALEEGEA